MDIIDSITNLKELASLPTIATKVLAMIDKEDVKVHDVSRIIEYDPSLTLKILKVVNSPIYATRKEIINVNDAIMMIGFRKLTNIVLGVSVFSMFWLSKRQGATNIMNKFWYHSSSTATIAKAVAKKINMNFNENEFVGGLLHQIGALAMIQYDLQKYQKVIEIIEKDKIPDFEAEKLVFGANHMDVGSRLVEQWKLPELFSEIITNCAHPSKVSNNRELVASVSFADLLSDIHGANFYSGSLPENIKKSESWKVLCQVSESFKDSGTESIESEIDGQLKASGEYMNSIIV